MLLHPPENRVKALMDLDAAISAQDGSLRQQSELVRLRRELGRTHAQMLRAGK